MSAEEVNHRDTGRKPTDHEGGDYRRKLVELRAGTLDGVCETIYLHGFAVEPNIIVQQANEGV